MFKEVGKIFRKKNPQDYMDPTKSSLPNIPIATRLEKKKKKGLAKSKGHK
jgi:hypothetical protein